MQRFQRKHPALYATRHVALAIVQVALPLLGLGALIAALLPQLDVSWVAEIGAFVRSLRVQVGMWIPDIGLPFPDLRETIREMVRSPMFESVKFVIGRVKWALPIIIAIFIAIKEVQRHKRKQRGQPSADEVAQGDRSDHNER